MVFKRKTKAESSTTLLLAPEKKGLFGNSKKTRSDSVPKKRLSKQLGSMLSLRSVKDRDGKAQMHEEMDRMMDITPPATPEQGSDNSDGKPLQVSVVTTQPSPARPHPDDVSTLTDLSQAKSPKKTRKSTSSTTARSIGRKSVDTNNGGGSTAGYSEDFPTVGGEDDIQTTGHYTYDGTEGTSHPADCSWFNAIDTLCAPTNPTPSSAIMSDAERARIMADVANDRGLRGRATPPAWGLAPSSSEEEETRDFAEDSVTVDDSITDATGESDTLFKNLPSTKASSKRDDTKQHDENADKSAHENFELVLDESTLEASGKNAANLRQKVRNWMRKREEERKAAEALKKQEKYRMVFGTDPSDNDEGGDTGGGSSSNKLAKATATGAVFGAAAAAAVRADASSSDHAIVAPQVDDATNARDNGRGLSEEQASEWAVSLSLGLTSSQNKSDDEELAVAADEPTPTANQQQPERPMTPDQQPGKIPAVPHQSSGDVRVADQANARATAALGPAIYRNATPKASGARSDDGTTAAIDPSTATDATTTTATPTKKKKPVWRSAKDPKTGNLYYYNRLTRQITWTKPENFDDSQEPFTHDKNKNATSAASSNNTNGKSVGSANKPLWKATMDQNTGRMYYYHRLTRKTTWTKPRGFDADQAKGKAAATPDGGVNATRTVSSSSGPRRKAGASDGSQNGKKSSNPIARALSFGRNKGSMSAEQQKAMDGNGSAPSRSNVVAPKILKKRPNEDSKVWVMRQQIVEKLTILTTPPPSEEEVMGMLDQYEGREGELLAQLESMEAADTGNVIKLNSPAPFDEPPSENEAPPPVFSMMDTVMSSIGVTPTNAMLSPEGTTASTPIIRARTGATAMTGHSSKTDRTEKTDSTEKRANTGKANENRKSQHPSVFDSITEDDEGDNTSISSSEVMDRYDPDVARAKQRRKAAKVVSAAERTRELKVEEFSSRLDEKRRGTESYGGRVVRPNRRPVERRQADPSPSRRQQQQQQQQPTTASVASNKVNHNSAAIIENNTHQSDVHSADSSEYMDEDEDPLVNRMTEDEISALSETDMEFADRKDRFAKSRRNVLERAIQDRDWDTAASLTDQMRTQEALAADDYPSSEETSYLEWTQSEVDKFISQNDWDAVANYIAVMRDHSERRRRRKEEFQRRRGLRGVPPLAGSRTGISSIQESEATFSSAASPTSPGMGGGGGGGPPAGGGGGGYRKRFGARSQLQHNRGASAGHVSASSSWESESSFDPSEPYSSDEDDFEDDLRKYASRTHHHAISSSRRKEFAC